MMTNRGGRKAVTTGGTPIPHPREVGGSMEPMNGLRRDLSTLAILEATAPQLQPPRRRDRRLDGGALRDLIAVRLNGRRGVSSY